ncbi:hypothetical protein Leryth_020611 [Lithospermum erythrorhizon]|nr:hypothetical protein Leryth_020611 [Lithospermum erythrorhizon]
MPHFFFIFTIFFPISFVLSRTTPLPSQTTVLDVSFETQKVQNVFFTDFNALNSLNQAEEVNPFEDSSSALSFQLHSRLAIEGIGSHQDYESLFMTRLDRDSARFNSILTHLNLVVQGDGLANLKPEEESELSSLEGMEMPVVSGVSQGSGEYFSRVGIGYPPSQAFMVLDTGSDVNWVQCNPCADCYQQADPIFEPGNSSTYHTMSCRARQCQSLDVSACVKDTCLYQVSYGDGSYSVGELASETITFGGEGGASAANIAIGCGHDNEGLFTGASGLLGLGGGDLSFQSQINASSFSYCLVDRDTKSTSTLEFDSITSLDAVIAPLLRNLKTSTYHYVDLTGLSVGGQPVPIPPSTLQLKDNGDGGVIVDSGTAITRFPMEVYNALREAFVKGTPDLTLTNGVAVFDTCYDLSQRKTVEIPTVSFRFSNGKEWSIPAKNYLVPIDSKGTFCFAFATTSSSMGIIGNVQQQGTRVSFDLKNSLIGFSNDKC